jgi:hypothetical protein
MIERVIIKNYRVFKELNFRPNESMNIIVGDNQAGKSTLMEAITMAVSGRIHGRPLTEELNPYWFNIESIDRFFEARLNGDKAIPPSILIEVYLRNDDEPQILRGIVNSEGTDCPGFAIEVEPDTEYSVEFEEYMKGNPPPILPTEYYKITWRGFNDKPLYRLPKELGVLHLDSKTSQPSRQIDIYARQLLKDLIDGKEGATISVQYRQQRHQLTSNILSDVNQRVKDHGTIFSDTLNLQLDQSSLSSWDRVVVPHIDRLPFGYVGQGQQVLIKTALALTAEDSNPQLVFVEEPENHLSHTSLFHSLDRIEKLAEGRQVFITTHSSYVLNRMGIDNLHLLHRGNMASFGELTDDTVEYFKKQSGYDTLRMVLARHLVIVEGPSDEMIFKRAYLDQTGRTTDEDQIDVIAQGTRNRRGLELCAALDRKVAVLRDNDGQSPAHWRDMAKAYLAPGKREMFVGDPSLGKTLEPQVANTNIQAGNDYKERLRKIVECTKDKRLEEFMTDDKTGWAWQIASAANSEKIKYPSYITEAIDFITRTM